MSQTLEEQIIGLKRTIAEMESQRTSLGDEFVDAGLVPFQRKLDELVALLQVRQSHPPAEQAQQRKLVTLLFMDIAGSTSIAQHMDPEDVSELFDATLKKLAAPVEAHGGRVTRFMGDGLLAVFGAIQAREDDPEQAVRAGLKIIELSSELAAQLQTGSGFSPFQVRVGVNTGLVLLGGQTEAENTLMGAAVNLSARLESAAPPGGLLISHDTYRHIRGVFDVEALPPISAKGFDEPVPVYRVHSLKPRAFRRHTRGVEGIETPMIGRETELKHLQDALLTAIEEGEGHIVTVIGEAGVGKSRLLYEFQDWIELLPSPAVHFFEGRAHPETQMQPYGLLRDLFSFRFHLQEDDSADVVRQGIQNGFMEAFGSSPDGEMRAHILGQLLGIDFSLSPHLKPLLNDAEQLRNRGLMYLGEYFRQLSGQNPVVIYLEDIHWADDSSLDALSWLGERLRRQSILVVCAARTALFERRPYWGEGQAYHTRLDLRPLSRRESRQLVGEILRFVADIPTELRELVVEGAEGNPFYLEELIKMLIENGVVLKGEDSWSIESERLTQIKVPPTLAGVLQARLDSLPIQERVVLQQASVVGRQFWDRIIAYIQAAGDGRAEIVPEALSTLRERELIYRREESAFAEAREYLFKHDILREVTYESVLKRLRSKYHGLVADWMIAQAVDRVGEYSGLIARHLLLAGRQERAGEYFLQAGQSSLATYANVEAEGYLRQALELSPSDVHKAACLAGLGEALSRQGHRDESLLVFHQGIELTLKLGNSDGAADLYRRLSIITWYIDQLQAWNVCQEGLTRLEGAPQSPGMARLLAEAGRTAHFQEKPAGEVIPLCRRAIEMAEHLGELEARADAAVTLALTTQDNTERLKLLQEVAAYSEANGLWFQAARAYHNLAVYLWWDHQENAVDAAHQVLMKSSELLIRIGNIESLLNKVYLLMSVFIAQGALNIAENKVAEILTKSTVPGSRLDEILESMRLDLFSPRGQWQQAVDAMRLRLAALHKSGNIQEFEGTSLDQATAILELDRFGRTSDLAQAEAALLENIQSDFFMPWTRFILAVIASRQARFAEAHQRLAEAIRRMPQPIPGLLEAERINAEAELARAEGRLEETVSKYLSLVDSFRNAGNRWEWARRLIDLGDAFLARDDPGDRGRAEEAYHQSLEMFTDMGAPGYVQVLQQRLEDLASGSDPS